MKTAEIEMSPRFARTEAERYSRCASLTKTDRAIMKAYKSIAHGGRIINLQKTLQNGGFDEQGYPKLAIARAAATRVDVRVWAGSTEFRWDFGYSDKRTMRVTDFGHNRQAVTDGWAKLPFVPPYIRRRDMGKFFILWEATWFKMPAGDPYLLEKIDENLFRIVAGWDITPLEAAVLRR